MRKSRPIALMVSMMLLALLLAGCGAAQPAITPVPPATAAGGAVAPTAAPPTAIPPTAVPPTPVPRTPVASLNPSARELVSMVYAKKPDRVVLFGGVTGNLERGYLDDTWVYDVAANKWTEMTPASGPGARCCADLVYNTKADRILLFGGARTMRSVLYDMWAYDVNTNTWQELKSGPPDHLGYRMAYDAESDRVILFGGWDMRGSIRSRKLFNDTWAYDFNSDTWTEMKPSASPSPRWYHAMAYDTESDRVILWGGEVEDGDPSVWAYDYNKNTWQKMASSGGPSLRDNMSMAYNDKADRIVLYGGSEKGNDETWAYDYNTNGWTRLAPATNAGVLSQYGFTYSTAADRVILFGGARGERVNNTQATFQETWTYDIQSNKWTNVTRRP